MSNGGGEIAKLDRWMKTSYAPPYRFTIQLTFKCNLDCKFCSCAGDRRLRGFRFPQELSDGEWLDVVRQGLDLDVAEWWFPGAGEPLARGGLLLEIFRTVKKKKPRAYCKITTNGSLFDEETIKELVRIKLDKISISLDSPRAKIHDFLRGKAGTFDRMSRALSRINHWKKALHSENPELNINTVLNSKNYDDLLLFEEFAWKNGIDHVSINPLRIDKANRESVETHGLRLTSSQKKRFAENIKRHRERPKNRVPIFLNGFNELEMGIVAETAEGFGTEETTRRKQKASSEDRFLNSSCFEPWLTMGINYDGNVTYCTSCGCWDRAENVRDRAIEDIWRGESFKYARDRMLRNKPLESCFGCGIMKARNEVKEALLKYHEAARNRRSHKTAPLRT